MSNLTSCKACAEQIIFLKTKNNKTIPVNFSSVSSVEKEFAAIGKEFPFVYGRHISHFATCTDSDKFRSSSKSDPERTCGERSQTRQGTFIPLSTFYFTLLNSYFCLLINKSTIQHFNNF